MTYEEAKQQMRRGDWVLVAQMVGVTFQYARNLSNRPRAKRYNEVMDALVRVVKKRAELMAKEEQTMQIARP